MLAVIYLFVMFLLGDCICRRFFSFLSVPHRMAVACLSGMLISTWFTYLAALVFYGTSMPLLWANLTFFAAAAFLIIWLRLGAKGEQPGDGTFRRYYRKIVGRGSAFDSEISNDVRVDAERRPAGIAKWDWIVLGICLVFGCWLMFATLDFSGGNFQFSYRAWGDFGANISLSQSFALGNNFPTEHPFVPGEAIRYHFLFWFSAANLSFLGLNLAWSINLLSLLSLGALLILIMTLGEVLFGSRAVGRIAAVLFFFGATSLSYIPFLWAQTDLSSALSAILSAENFLDSGYPFRGESWGGLTIAVFAYQRHLISAAGIFLIVLVFLADLYRRKGIITDIEAGTAPDLNADDISERRGSDDSASKTDPEEGDEFAAVDGEGLVRLTGDDPAERADGDRNEALPAKIKQRPPRLSFADFRDEIEGLIFSGALIGALPYWNSAVFGSAAIVLGCLLVFFPYRRYLAILIVTTIALGLPQVMLLRSGNIAQAGQSLFRVGYTIADPTLALVLEYIGWTFGFKLALIFLALWFVSWKHRLLFLVFTSLVPVVFLFQLSTDAFNNHKLINIWNVLVTVYVAYALWRIGRRSVVRTVLAVILAVAMVAGALIDLFPLHNHGFVSVPHKGDRLTEWLLENTQPSDIFLTDLFLSHPILFTGRKIFMGNTLFAWTAGYDLSERDRTYKTLFKETDAGELIRILNRNRITYVAIDDGVRANRQLTAFNETVYKQNFEVVFDDTDRKYSNLTIYRVPESARETALPIVADMNADMSIGPVSAFDGGHGKGRGQFASARGIAVDGEGNFYVADAHNGRIQKFSPDGSFISTIGTEGGGEGELREPNGIAIDANGDVYVADSARNRLLRFRADGTFVKEWAGPEPKFFGPRAVALGANNQVYVLDQGRSRVVRLDPESDKVIEWGTQGSDNNQFLEPTGIGFGGDRVYVSDARNNRIQVFDIDGKFIAAWAVPEWNSYPWQYPAAVFDARDKCLYVTSPLSKEVLVFDIDGNRLEPLKLPETALENPSALALANTKAGKRLYVLNTGRSNVFRFDMEAKAEIPKSAIDGNSKRSVVKAQTPLP